MKKSFVCGMISCSMLVFSGNLCAEVHESEIFLSVYNSGTALVRDLRNVTLQKGKNSLVFQNVAEKMLPETAFVQGKDIQVREQNYNYNLKTATNIIDESVGKTVKTALWDEASGKMIFDKAKIIDSRYGRPILEFDYGVEVNFPGRLIFDELPENLVSVPTLSAELEAQNAGKQALWLTYLTKGISWKVDYSAEMLNDKELNLLGWITLNNESGTDYKNASLQFVAGDVNLVNTGGMGPKPLLMSARAQNEDMALMAKTTLSNPRPQKLGDYYVYTLPFKTTVLNNQSKQLALLDKKNVVFEKKYKFTSPLYLWNGVTGGNFDEKNPEVSVEFNNDKASGLGEVLPQGIIRFYDKTISSNVQFVGESVFENSMIGKKSEFTLGKAFDLNVSGKILNVRKLENGVVEAEMEIVFHNASKQNESVVFVQNFNALWEIVSESNPLNSKTAEKAEWIINVPKQGKSVLMYKVKLSSVDKKD